MDTISNVIIYNENRSCNSYQSLKCLSWFENCLREVSKFVYLKLKHLEPMKTEVSQICNRILHISELKFKENDKIYCNEDYLNGTFGVSRGRSVTLDIENFYLERLSEYLNVMEKLDSSNLLP